jgi:hypothetical protein
MKTLLMMILLFVGLLGSAYALDTGQTDSIKIPQSISGMEYNHAVMPTEGTLSQNINIWHKDTLMQGGDNGLHIGTNSQLNLATIGTMQTSTTRYKAASAEDVGGV